MANGKSPWRQLFDNVERTIANPLESLANTREFATAMAMGTRLRRQLDQMTDELVAATVHRFGLPARRDVTDMARAVARVERRLQQLSHELETAREDDQYRRAAEPPDRDGGS